MVHGVDMRPAMLRPIGNSTKAKFRDSGLIDKLSQVKMSKQSADLVAMAEGALAFFNG